MKKTNTKLLMVALVLVSIPATLVLASAFDGGSKSVTLGPNGNGLFRIGTLVNKKVSVKARADHGRAHIKVVNGSGRTVARGVNSLNFRTGKKKSKYKIMLTNKTKKVQKVKVSYTATDDLWD